MLFLFSYGLSMLLLGFLADKTTYKNFLAIGIFPACFALYMMGLFAYLGIINIYWLCLF